MLLQVNIPISIPGQGPLSIALLGLAKSDRSLIDIAARLAPHIAAAVPALDQPGDAEGEEEEEASRKGSNVRASTSAGGQRNLGFKTACMFICMS